MMRSNNEGQEYFTIVQPKHTESCRGEEENEESKKKNWTKNIIRGSSQPHSVKIFFSNILVLETYIVITGEYPDQ